MKKKTLSVPISDLLISSKNRQTMGWPFFRLNFFGLHSGSKGKILSFLSVEHRLMGYPRFGNETCAPNSSLQQFFLASIF